VTGHERFVENVRNQRYSLIQSQPELSLFLIKFNLTKISNDENKSHNNIRRMELKMSGALFPFFPFFLLLCRVRPACDHGIGFYWAFEYRKTLSTAWADSSDFSGKHTAELIGSFVSRITGPHTFELWSKTYGIDSADQPWTRFEFDFVNQGTNPDQWQWPAGVLVRDFRYQMSLAVQKPYYSVRLSIAADFADHPMSDLDGDLISTCDQSGCRDTSLSRDPYSCQPSPSPTASRTPTATLSKSPSPTRSHSPSPTASGTPSPTLSRSPPPTHSRSPTASASLPFRNSNRFPESLTFDESATFRGSHRQSQSLTFVISSAFCESLFAIDSLGFSESAIFDHSLPFTTDSAAVTGGELRVGLIAGVVSSLAVVIGLLIAFVILKKCKRKTSHSSDVIFRDFGLEEVDHSSTASTIDGRFEDKIPDALFTVTYTVEDGD
jgi:hypothetical protein